ncbi:MAG: hypothetical protein D6759_15620 [Chloroflexi bacterium]|nr:MAG: hypothetical protein D6759_15620 [Chloroflexota bacterium]
MGGDRYNELINWLRTRYPLVLAEWEKHQRERSQRSGGLEDPGKLATIRAIQAELTALGIEGGTPGITSDGTPCVYLTKKGLYGKAYEETVTLARLQDHHFRRQLRMLFG